MLKISALKVFILLLISCFYLQGKTIEINESKDVQQLENFFRKSILEEGMSYVLFGEKPMILCYFPTLENITAYHNLDYSEKWFENSLAFHSSTSLWDKYLSTQNNFVYKSIYFPDEDGAEFLFINISKLKNVIEENISLFRYILGPLLTVDQILNRIAYSDEHLMDFLHDDSVLTGIVLGYGTNNSLLGGRVDKINCTSLSEKMPFSNSNLVYENNSTALHYLEQAGGGKKEIIYGFDEVKPSDGFVSLAEEITAIQDQLEPLPECLNKEPRYVCGAYKNESSNQIFFNKLLECQKRSLKLLDSESFLEDVFTLLFDEKIQIKKDVKTTSNIHPLDQEDWIKIISNKAKTFHDERKELVFLQSFSIKVQPTLPISLGANEEMLKGIKIAKANLEISNKSFANHKKDDSLTSVVDEYLYFKTDSKGAGIELKDYNRVKLSFTIFEGSGKPLRTVDNNWINLHETIPGFAKGIIGMKVGEERTIYIHPALGYGDYTTFPLCVELVANVTLHEIDEKVAEKLLYPEPFNFDSLFDEELYSDIEKSIEALPPYNAYFYRTMLDKQSDIDKQYVLEEIKKRAEKLKEKISFR